MTTVGSVTGRPASAARGSAYGKLLKRVKAAGLLDRRPGYYTLKVTLTVLAFAGTWVAFVVVGPSWWQPGVAALLAVVYTQVAFIGHDAGHKQIFRTRRANYLLGVALGNLGVGLSYGWWIDKHNRHHAHPNEVGSDPDIEPGVLVFTGWHAPLRSRALRLWRRAQAYMFFPLLLLEGLNLHVASVRALAGPTVRSRADRALETTLFAVHTVAYLAVVFLVLPPWQAIAFIAVHQALFGFYMGCSFAPNHKGMPVLTADDDLDYLRRQVLTSRNIRGGRLTDFVLGGLNYQIEHHLFPSMPRPNLRRSQHLIRRFCAEHGVSYAETGVFASYRQVLRHLHQVGRQSADPPLRAQES
ncbi:fatty acid desaturase [Micromonospora sp. Llam0]|uniref:fatty acid desaturase family protein n=1 Tax=Micromonospora sp. Llam0 TaxID=2485143 RepID=UPI000F49CB05|nr:acyl-CoA desaturase [Micromonospora sp. Llam0]ROO63244.1 fatty acid desaturase [Micromonospora sp. Llam0]